MIKEIQLRILKMGRNYQRLIPPLLVSIIFLVIAFQSWSCCRIGIRRAGQVCASSHPVILHQLCQGGVLQPVRAQEAVGVGGGIDEEVFAAVLRQVGQDIALDPFTDSDQEAAWHACAQKFICSR